MSIQLKSDGISDEWYELPDGGGTKFKIRPLSSRERLDVMGVMQAGKLGSAAVQALDSALLDWEGVLNDKGEPVRFSATAIERLPTAALTAVYKRILEISSTGEEQQKN